MSLIATLGLARAADAYPIAAMSRDAIEQGLGWSWTPARVRRSICSKDTTVVVARRDAGIDAFAIMQLLDESAHLNLLAVAAAQRRRGLASRLIDWLASTAIEAGIFRIDLELRAGNAAARAFYERSGFTETGRSPGYYRGLETAVRMSRDLARRL